VLQKADVIVGADGANSTVRRAMENELQPRVVEERNKYIWFGTPKVVDEFNFIFEDTPSGTGVRRLAPRRGRTGGDGLVDGPRRATRHRPLSGGRESSERCGQLSGRGC